MMSPLDGRVKVEDWATSEGGTFQKYVDENQREEFADGTAQPAPATTDAVERPVHVAASGCDEYAVILDTHASLSWTKSEVNHPHLIVGSKVDDACFALLAAAGIAYVVADEAHIDLSKLLETLDAGFGIKRILLECGATNSAAFPKAKLVDEMSYVLFSATGGKRANPRFSKLAKMDWPTLSASN